MPPGYLRRAVELVRAAGGLFICDEVQTGFGRTGAGWWAFEQEGVVPDVVVVAKGLGNGFPIAAMVARRDVAESMARRKFFNTYGANPMACAAARAVLRAIDDEGLVGNALRVGELFGAALAHAAQYSPDRLAVRGRGLMRGIEFMHADRRHAPDDARAARVQEALREQGVIVGRSGQYGNVLRINPPLCVDADAAALFARALDAALDAS